MKTGSTDPETLRRHFASGTEAAQQGESCPPAGKIWDAVHEDLDALERREIVGHLRSCASCAAEWRSAMDPEETKEESAAARPARPVPFRIPWLPLAAAALILLGAGLALLFRQPGGTSEMPDYRAAEVKKIRPLVPDGEALPRDRFLLRWSPVEEDARYTLKVNRQDLTPVTVARNLLEPRHQIPVDALAEIRSGATLVWRVEAHLVDGRKITSDAFLVRLE